MLNNANTFYILFVSYQYHKNHNYIHHMYNLPAQSCEVSVDNDARKVHKHDVTPHILQLVAKYDATQVHEHTARENPYVALDGTVRVQNLSKFFI